MRLSDMKRLEQHAVQQGVSILELMEHAGEQVYQTVKREIDTSNKHIIIFCGTGNNAGDGFVAARHFTPENPVTILLFGDEAKLSSEADFNLQRIKNKITISNIRNKQELALFKIQQHLDLICIDALLGTGITGSLREPIASAIDYFNSLPGFKVAVDIPSGLNPDTGEVPEKMCDVDLIICFHDLKAGLEKFKDKVVVVDIGIPAN